MIGHTSRDQGQWFKDNPKMKVEAWNDRVHAPYLPAREKRRTRLLIFCLLAEGSGLVIAPFVMPVGVGLIALGGVAGVRYQLDDEQCKSIASVISFQRMKTWANLPPSVMEASANPEALYTEFQGWGFREDAVCQQMKHWPAPDREVKSAYVEPETEYAAEPQAWNFPQFLDGMHEETFDVTAKQLQTMPLPVEQKSSS